MNNWTSAGKKMMASDVSSLSHQSSIPMEDDMDDDGMCEGKDNVKRKTRNLSEKKRRDQFNVLVGELANMVATNNSKIDKTTVLKTTISVIKNHKDICDHLHAHEIQEDWKPSFLTNDEFTQLMLEALDGFLMVITKGGTILFISDGVTSLLHYLPGDLLKRSFFDFVHFNDRSRIHNLLSSFPSTQLTKTAADHTNEDNQVEFSCHIRCGRLRPTDKTLYEKVQCRGNFRLCTGAESPTETPSEVVCLCCTVCINRRSQVIREVVHSSETKREFTARHSLEWKFLFLDHRGPSVIGYLPFEVLGTSGYDYVHEDDLQRLAACHEQLMQKGGSLSCYYRFLTKGQQWIWLQSRYYITYHQWTSKPEFVVCTNRVVNYSEVQRCFWDEKESGEQSPSSVQSPQGCATSTIQSSQIDGHLAGQSSPKSPVTSSTSNLPAASSSSPITASLPSTPVITMDTNQNPQQPQQQQQQQQPQSDMVVSLPSVVSPSSPLRTTPITVAVATQPGGGDGGGVASSSTAAAISPGQRSGTVGGGGGSGGMPQLLINPIQHRLQEQLLQRHQQLQDGILKQQQELNIIAEQLLLTSHLAVLQQQEPNSQQQQQNTGSLPVMSQAGGNPQSTYGTPPQNTFTTGLLAPQMSDGGQGSPQGSQQLSPAECFDSGVMHSPTHLQPGDQQQQQQQQDSQQQQQQPYFMMDSPQSNFLMGGSSSDAVTNNLLSMSPSSLLSQTGGKPNHPH